jgi:hypothetical protein
MPETNAIDLTPDALVQAPQHHMQQQKGTAVPGSASSKAVAQMLTSIQ